MNRPLRWPLALLLLPALAAHAGDVAAASAVPPDKIDALISREMAQRKLPSVTLVVMKNGVVVRQAAYGLARLDPPAPATTATRHRLDSLTKQFTAGAILVLQQQGRLRVQDPVRQYLPAAPASWAAITLRQLLNHTAGFPRDLPAGAGDTLPRLYQMQPLSPPGTRWLYSNAGYIILGAVIEAASGQSYSAFLRQNLFAPAGMTDTCLADVREAGPELAAGYDWQPSRQRWQAHAPGHPPLAAAAVESTVLDLAKWEIALQSDAILTTESKQQMWGPLVLKNGDEYDYGFGWLIDDGPLGRLISHGGSGWGYSTAYHRYPDAGYTIIVLTNLQPGKGNYHADALAGAIAREVIRNQ